VAGFTAPRAAAAAELAAAAADSAQPCGGVTVSWRCQVPNGRRDIGVTPVCGLHTGAPPSVSRRPVVGAGGRR